MSITRRLSPAAIDGDTATSTGFRRNRAWRRLGRAALIVAAGSAALTLAGPMGLRPFVDATKAAGAAGDVTVAFVIDFGTGTPVVGCVSVPASDNRYDALAAFVGEKKMAPPTYAPSGLLCSINAVPLTGCGQIVVGGYVYWSYFTGGTGSWAYANSGASGLVTSGDVEGWRFQNPGKGNPGDPAPRSTARFDAICAPVSPTTTTIATTTTTTTIHPQPGSGPRPQGTGLTPAPSGSNVVGRSSSTTNAPSTTTTTTSSPCSPSTTTTTIATTTTTKSTPTTTTTTTSWPCSSTTTTSSTPPTTSPSAVSVPAAPVAALGVADHSAGASGSGSGPLIIGGLLIVALGMAAFARWRKRPRTP